MKLIYGILLPQRVIAHELARVGLTGVGMRPDRDHGLVAGGSLREAVFYRFVEWPVLDRLHAALLPRRQPVTLAGD